MRKSKPTRASFPRAAGEDAARLTPITGISRRVFLASAGAAGLMLRCAPLAAGVGQAASVQPGALEQAFRKPPDGSKPWVYWWWLDGAASAAGITADLETLKAQGV